MLCETEMKKPLLVSIGILAVFVGWKIFTSSCLDCGDSLNPEVVAKVFASDVLKAAFFRIKIDLGRYPTTEEGLDLLFHEPASDELKKKWKGPYIEFPLLDPWGNPFQYRNPGVRNKGSYDIFSFGPDGVPSDDDIGNWE